MRKAFDDEENPYLPKVRSNFRHYLFVNAKLCGETNIETFNFMQHILYRQKEQFSDGVGYSWIDGLKAHAAKHVTNPTFFLFNKEMKFAIVTKFVFLVIDSRNFPLGDR